MDSTRQKALTSTLLVWVPFALAELPPMMTGPQLHETCSRTAPTYKTACIAYVGGVAEGVVVQHAFGNDNESDWGRIANEAIRPFCVPPATNRALMADAVSAYLSTHAGEIGDPGAVLVWRALRLSFPCKPLGSR